MCVSHQGLDGGTKEGSQLGSAAMAPPRLVLGRRRLAAVAGGDSALRGHAGARSPSPSAGWDGPEPGLAPPALPRSRRAEPDGGHLPRWVGSGAWMLGLAQLFECTVEEMARKWTGKCLATLRLRAEGEEENPTF